MSKADYKALVAAHIKSVAEKVRDLERKDKERLEAIKSLNAEEKLALIKAAYEDADMYSPSDLHDFCTTLEEVLR